MSTADKASIVDLSPAPERTVWGLSPAEIHARFWASRGVQVVCPGRASEIVRHAELFLLTDPRTLAIFRVAPLLDTMEWLRPTILNVRLRDPRERGYREEVVTDSNGRFVRFHRHYRGADHRVARVVLTSDAGVARLWQNARDIHDARAAIREGVERPGRAASTLRARVYNATEPGEIERFMHDIVRDWRRPDASIARPKHSGERAWIDPTARIARGSSIVGPLWVGAGRTLPEGAVAVGPSVMWDDPAARPGRDEVRWLDLEPLSLPPMVNPAPVPELSKLAKRAFDVLFALVALLCTLPLYPIIMLAIWLEDRAPSFFFSHTRETLGGREFGCIKFRSMRPDAELIKAQLMAQNKADGPQFFIENDPRSTKVGVFLRKYQLDELPQFWNVLSGDMSIVGPRPSPHKENQFSPAWREARLSVRPGMTGLWQIRRTRKEGNDFQEWIRFDIEYVETRSFWLDIKIIARTVGMIFGKLINR